MSTRLRSSAERIRSLARLLEDLWFDRTRHVRTAGQVRLAGLELAGDGRDSFMYVPARARNIRAALNSLPDCDFVKYTFIDLGSGCGRALFVAAEYPFRLLLGVEIATALHLQAERNIGQFNKRRRRPSNIHSVNTSAADFSFPEGNLIVYLFNPFGPEVMKRVVRSIDASLLSRPRDLFLVMLYPEFAGEVDASICLSPFLSTDKFMIFRSRLAAVTESA